MTQPEMITAAEAAEVLGCSPRTVARMAGDGRLVYALKLPGKTGPLVFHRADVVAFAAELKASA